MSLFIILGTAAMVYAEIRMICAIAETSEYHNSKEDADTRTGDAIYGFFALIVIIGIVVTIIFGYRFHKKASEMDDITIKNGTIEINGFEYELVPVAEED